MEKPPPRGITLAQILANLHRLVPIEFLTEGSQANVPFGEV